MNHAQIGRTIRRRRLAHGWSLRHVAALAGLRDTTVLRLERGQFANPSSRALTSICLALGIPLTRVLSAIDDGRPEFAQLLRTHYPELSESAVEELAGHFEVLVGHAMARVAE